MQIKRLTIALYDFTALLVVAFIASFAFTQVAWAYVDPSVMTYTIQALAGVAVALSAVAGVAFRRGRKHLYKLLDIDENAKKQYEPAVQRISSEQDEATTTVQLASSEQGEAALDSVAVSEESPDSARSPRSATPLAQAEAEKLDEDESSRRAAVGEASSRRASRNRRLLKGDPNPYKPKWKERIVYALIAATFTICTIFVFAPLEVVGGSVGSLVFTVADVWWVTLPTSLAIIIGWSFLISACRGRLFGFMLMLTFAVGLAAYVQALVLNVGLPLANGDTIVWTDYMGMQVLSTVVWLAIIIGVLTYGHFRNKRAQGVVAILSTFLFVVQFVGAASLFFAPTELTEVNGGGGDALNTDLAHRTEVVMTEDQLFTVNPNHNVIVFVLDTYDNAYLNSALRNKHDITQEVLDEFTGFTYFKNATSAMIPTRFAIPFMMTGQMPTPDEPFSTYKAQRYARSTFLQEMADQGYSIGLYTDSLTIGMLPQEEQNRITDLTVNMHKLSSETLDFGGALYALYQMGLYRNAPWPLKWAFWYYTDSINAMIVKYDPAAPPEETIYVIDDIRYYNRLNQYGLTLEDEKAGYKGGFRFIHLLGSHYPFNYDENVNDLGTDGSSVIPQSIGALRIVATYIQYLKDAGVYDNTTIIVTADHGYWTITLDPIEETSTPIMFVKPAQSAELDELPMVDDMTPVSHLDLQATILEAMGADPSEWQAYGYSMLSPDEIPDDRVRLYLTTDSEPDLTDVRLREYAIDGDAQVWENWSETGRIWSTQE